MNVVKRKAVATCLLPAALLLAPAQAGAAAVPAGGALQGMTAGYVHQAQVRGDPAEGTSSSGESFGGGGPGDRGETGTCSDLPLSSIKKNSSSTATTGLSPRDL